MANSETGAPRSWGYKRADELYSRLNWDNPGGFREEESREALLAPIQITRLAPEGGTLELEWYIQEEAVTGGELHYRIKYGQRGSGSGSGSESGSGSGSGAGFGAGPTAVVECGAGAVAGIVAGLEDGLDYWLQVEAYDPASGATASSSAVRLVTAGAVPGKVINFIHPDDYTYNFSGRSPASPSIAQLPDGWLVASHDIYWGEAKQNLSKIFRSSDGGNTWSYVTDLYPCFWGKLFVHGGSLYMLATSTEYGALLIGRSDDGGDSWSAPTTLMEGGSRETGGPHKAPMPVIAHKGRLWTAIDHGSWVAFKGHRSGVISAPVDADLLDPASWTATPFLAYDPAWPDAIEGGLRPGLLEGNMVVLPGGKLVNLLRYETIGGKPELERAIYLEANANEPGAPLVFGKVIDFIGNMSKFTVYWDERSGYYWSLVSRVKNVVGQRNILSLVRSVDGEQWELVQDIWNYEDNGWDEDHSKVGFQYVDWMIDGDDLLLVSRTAINGAHDYHNANYLVFERLSEFRRLGGLG